MPRKPARTSCSGASAVASKLARVLHAFTPCKQRLLQRWANTPTMTWGMSRAKHKSIVVPAFGSMAHPSTFDHMHANSDAMSRINSTSLKPSLANAHATLDSPSVVASLTRVVYRLDTARIKGARLLMPSVLNLPSCRRDWPVRASSIPLCFEPVTPKLYAIIDENRGDR